jgi:hypothetical protein
MQIILIKKAFHAFMLRGLASTPLLKFWGPHPGATMLFGSLKLGKAMGSRHFPIHNVFCKIKIPKFATTLVCKIKRAKFVTLVFRTQIRPPLPHAYIVLGCKIKGSKIGNLCFRNSN